LLDDELKRFMDAAKLLEHALGANPVAEVWSNRGFSNV
jgi:hypothetical protein